MLTFRAAMVVCLASFGGLTPAAASLAAASSSPGVTGAGGPGLDRAALAVPPVVPGGAGRLPPSRPEESAEVLELRSALARDVPHLVARTAAGDAGWVALTRAEVLRAGMVVDRPQLLVVVDRNPRVQQLAVVAAMPEGEWTVVGGTKVSTGSKGREDHYITPRGVFHVTTAILGYRAEGTLNENGIRGLGAKGMRVWDFGWQVAAKGWNAGPGKPDRIPIRLMMHATDPDKLEQRIGQPASQGCVRIPTAMNRFLDHYGVLDAEYERAAATEVRFRALLPAGREPSGLAGNTLVVIDSADRSGVDMASRTIP